MPKSKDQGAVYNFLDFIYKYETQIISYFYAVLTNFCRYIFIILGKKHWTVEWPGRFSHYRRACVCAAVGFASHQIELWARLSGCVRARCGIKWLQHPASHPPAHPPLNLNARNTFYLVALFLSPLFFSLFFTIIHLNVTWSTRRAKNTATSVVNFHCLSRSFFSARSPLCFGSFFYFYAHIYSVRDVSLLLRRAFISCQQPREEAVSLLNLQPSLSLSRSLSQCARLSLIDPHRTPPLATSINFIYCNNAPNLQWWWCTWKKGCWFVCLRVCVCASAKGHNRNIFLRWKTATNVSHIYAGQIKQIWYGLDVPDALRPGTYNFLFSAPLYRRDAAELRWSNIFCSLVSNFFTPCAF